MHLWPTVYTWMHRSKPCLGLAEHNGPNQHHTGHGSAQMGILKTQHSHPHFIWHSKYTGPRRCGLWSTRGSCTVFGNVGPCLAHCGSILAPAGQ